MRRGERLPLLWLAPGAVADPRGLLRFGPLDDVFVPVGPVVLDGPSARGRRAVHGVGVGGVEHEDAAGIDLVAAIEGLRWAAARSLRVSVCVRGGAPGEAAAVVGRLCRSLEGDAVGAVEVDLRGADDQHALKVLARVREVAPRDLLLLARLSALQPGLVASARGAVAGGAGAVVVCGSVGLAPGRWWSGPSTAAVCRAGVRALTEAAAEQRWPAVPLVAAGGVHDAASARLALSAGAAAVMLGTALWADPTLLHRLQDELDRASVTRPSEEST